MTGSMPILHVVPDFFNSTRRAPMVLSNRLDCIDSESLYHETFVGQTRGHRRRHTSISLAERPSLRRHLPVACRQTIHAALPVRRRF